MTLPMAITVYGRPSCQPCRLTKTKFERARVAFTYVDVDEDTAALEGLTDLEWVSALPVVITDDPEIGEWCALRPDKIKTVCRRYGSA